MSERDELVERMEDSQNRLDDELHGENYELYVYLHDSCSIATDFIEADELRIAEWKKIILQKNEQKNAMQDEIESLKSKVAELEGYITDIYTAVFGKPTNPKATPRGLAVIAQFESLTAEAHLSDIAFDAVQAKRERLVEALKVLGDDKLLVDDNGKVSYQTIVNQDYVARKRYANEQLKEEGRD